MHLLARRLPLAAMLLLLAGSPFSPACPLRQARAADEVDSRQDHYLEDVKPLLARRCYACHGPLKQESGLRLDTGAAIRQGGDSGQAAQPGKPEESLLLLRISAADPGQRMPPEGDPLTAEEIGHIKNWIAQGAVSPEEEHPAEDPRSHWSFQKIVRPVVPAAKEADANPIDAFLSEAHRRLGLVPNGPADKATLARRVYLDLVGVPPTPEELQAFLADTHPAAYEALVDRLLASPRYGERWGRHWMDVWRYSDWYGRRAEGEIRYSQRHIWRWRDWIIESQNADKGYDQMIVEMLAADEAAPADLSAARATGFLGRNWYKFDRDAWLFETVEQTSMAFLGLTMRCARCHDHKFDPVSQEEYYRFRAYFEPHEFRIDPAPQGDERKSSGESSAGLARVFDKQLDAATWFYRRGEPRQADKERPLLPSTPAVLGGASHHVQPVSLPVQAWYPALRPDVVQATRQALLTTSEQARAALAALQASGSPPPADLRAAELRLAAAESSLASFDARLAAEQARLAGAAEAPALAVAAGRSQRAAAVAAAAETFASSERARQSLDAAASPAAVAEADKKLTEARQSLDAAQAAVATADANPAAPEAASYAPLGESFPATSSGRRLALARWIASGDNPRTARVAVNHIWLRHFGEALVPTVANLGLGGQKPVLPELLDWLASELVDSGWSTKRLHRLIVTSAAYRRSSSPPEASIAAENARRDRENRYFWRMNVRRMEAEAVRDSILAVSTGLDSTIGGPELDESLGQASRRRSLYFRVTPDNKMEMLELFDLANPNECYRRGESVTPQQALAMTNSALAQSEARAIARLIAGELGANGAGAEGAGAEGAGADGLQAFIRAAYLRVLSRFPSNRELALCEQFLREQSSGAGGAELVAFPASPQPAGTPPATDPAERAREELVQVLLNHHEFLTIR